MPGMLDGRVAVVTGGGSGMGRATCVRFAEEGADVIVADLNDEGGLATVREVEALGRRAFFQRVDTTDEPAVVALMQAAAERLGRLDVCVAAAGISYASYLAGDEETDPFINPEAGLLLNKPTSSWQKVLDVNLTGVMLTNREAARAMIALGHGGTIVNFASEAAYRPSDRLQDYNVSKAGVVMLTKCLAIELAPHDIRVNAIAPGAHVTPMLESQLQARREAGLGDWDATPLGRAGEPREAANVVLFLASEQSSFVTGKTIGSDGGNYTI